MANQKIKATVNQGNKKGAEMSKTVANAVNSKYCKVQVLGYEYIDERGNKGVNQADLHSRVVGIEMIVINKSVIANDPFCMTSKVLTSQCVRLTDRDWEGLIGFYLNGVSAGYVEEDSFDSWLSNKVANKGLLGIKSEFLK